MSVGKGSLAERLDALIGGGRRWDIVARILEEFEKEVREAGLHLPDCFWERVAEATQGQGVEQ